MADEANGRTPGKVVVITDDRGMVRGIGACFSPMPVYKRGDLGIYQEAEATDDAWNDAMKKSYIEPFDIVIQGMRQWDRQHRLAEVAKNCNWSINVQDASIPALGGDSE